MEAECSAGAAGQASAAARGLLPPSAAEQAGAPAHPLHAFPDYCRSGGMQLPPLMLPFLPPAVPSPSQASAYMQPGAGVPPAQPLVPAAAWAQRGAWGSPGLTPVAAQHAEGDAQAEQLWQHAATAQPQERFRQQQQQPFPQPFQQQFPAALVARSGAAAAPTAAAMSNTAAHSPPEAGSLAAGSVQGLHGGSASGPKPLPLASVDAEPACPLPYLRLQPQRMSSSDTDSLQPGSGTAPLLAPAVLGSLPAGHVMAGSLLPPGSGGGMKLEGAVDLQALVALLGSNAFSGAAAQGQPLGLGGLQLTLGSSSGQGSTAAAMAGLPPAGTGEAGSSMGRSGACLCSLQQAPAPGRNHAGPRPAAPTAGPGACQPAAADAKQQHATSVELHELLGGEDWML